LIAAIRTLNSSFSRAFARSGDDDDAALVARARRGDPSAYEEIVCRHQTRIYNLVYRMLRSREDAEDVTQEAFLRAFESLPRLRDRAAVGAWISRIAANLCVDWLRSPARLEIPVDPAHFHDAILPGGAFDAPAHARQAVRELPPRYRLAVVAFYLEGRSYADAARTLGISVRALKTQLYRARSMLRDSVRESGPGDGGAT
jgi:RNA polymerase sigma-70 factor (ECF subfamily)